MSLSGQTLGTTASDISNPVAAFLERAVEGNSRACTRQTLDLLDEGVPPAEVIVHLLGAAQREAGERWQRNGYTVSDEHLVSSSTQKALDALANTADSPAPVGLIVVACAEGDWHSLPAQMFTELLRTRGFNALFLGASVPADHVAAFLSRRPADALAVSCNLPLSSTASADSLSPPTAWTSRLLPVAVPSVTLRTALYSSASTPGHLTSIMPIPSCAAGSS